MSNVIVSILDGIQDVLQGSTALKGYGVCAHAVTISENGDIAPSLPMPGIAIASGAVTRQDRDMAGHSSFITFEAIIHAYTEDFSKANHGPDTPSKDLKSLCYEISTLLHRNKMGLTLLDANVGTIVFPAFSGRNYVDRWEGRIPLLYRWIECYE
jgi:hypothetical protein